MIIRNGIEYRNLEEQVQANKNDIARIIEGEELLARLGIKVVGQVENATKLPNPVTYDGEFGDAFLVGTDTPYDYYIFTRPFEGETDPQWFDLGPFPVAGPQGIPGPQGPAGIPGIRGSQWFSGTGQPSTTSGYNIGDYYINVGTGNIWHLHNVEGAAKWLLEGNIKGPQGPQGPRGLTGPAGPEGPEGPQGPMGPTAATVEIIGVYSSVDSLPNPETEAPRNAGALVGTSGNYKIYIITGDEGGLRWTNVGPFSAGSIVKVNGIPQPTWNADTKLNTGNSMVYSADGKLRIYQMAGGPNGTRTGTYQEMRGDCFYTRSEENRFSAQYSPTQAYIANLSDDSSTSYTNGQIRYQPPGTGYAYVNKLPTSDGTLINDTEIDRKITNSINGLVLPMIANAITSNGQWIPGGSSHDIRPKVKDASKGYMVMLKSDTDTPVKFTADRYGGETLTLYGKAIIVFVAKEPAPYSEDYFSTWAISVDNWANADAEVGIVHGNSISISNQQQPCQEFIFEY